MKKAVFTAMAVLSLPVFLNSCGLFEQSSCSCDKTLPPPTTQPAAPAAKTDAPKPETLEMSVPEGKELEAAPKQETAPAPEGKKSEAAPAQEIAPAPEGKKSEAAPAQETPKVSPPEKIELPCKHVVKTNDSLWRLAVEYYGKGAKWTLIYEANKDKIRNPDHLEPGTELTIPVSVPQ